MIHLCLVSKVARGFTFTRAGSVITFHEATSQLLACTISLSDMALEADVAVMAIRHSRLDPSNASYESPPPNWRRALISLARKRVTALQAFADTLEKDSPMRAVGSPQESPPERPEQEHTEPPEGPERGGR